MTILKEESLFAPVDAERPLGAVLQTVMRRAAAPVHLRAPKIDERFLARLRNADGMVGTGPLRMTRTQNNEVASLAGSFACGQQR